ncbi:hypothetical protein E2C01_032199 [Portunus trituberculatus]|uniref:Uncharacterized protein n=1 Tax=Portunus trituberculatus TaxID=210409 RepID=A0A5B7F0B1_PORTR|nr:hypothetical protein [Portunus trituberculatus]
MCLSELNPKYKKEDDLTPKNKFRSQRHTPLQTQTLQGGGHILMRLQHLYPKTEEQNQRSERSITNLPHEKSPMTPNPTEDNMYIEPYV